LRWILKSCVDHQNHGRPQMALGPGLPDPPSVVARPPAHLSRHRSAAVGRYAPNRYWVACITNIRSRPCSADLAIADQRRHAAALSAASARDLARHPHSDSNSLDLSPKKGGSRPPSTREYSIGADGRLPYRRCCERLGCEIAPSRREVVTALSGCCGSPHVSVILHPLQLRAMCARGEP